MAVFPCIQPVEEAGREAGAEHADGMCQHSPAQQQGERLPIDASIILQQGVTFTVVLHQGQCGCPLAGVL